MDHERVFAVFAVFVNAVFANTVFAVFGANACSRGGVFLELSQTGLALGFPAPERL